MGRVCKIFAITALLIMRSPHRLIVAAVASYMISSSSGCAVLEWPSRQPRSGTLVASDGSPLANAEVEVSTWGVERPGRTREGLVHRLVTRTDQQGHFAVRGGATLTFTILGLPESPGYEDEYTFRSAREPDLVVSEPQL